MARRSGARWLLTLCVALAPLLGSFGCAEEDDPEYWADRSHNDRISFQVINFHPVPIRVQTWYGLSFGTINPGDEITYHMCGRWEGTVFEATDLGRVLATFEVHDGGSVPVD